MYLEASVTAQDLAPTLPLVMMRTSAYRGLRLPDVVVTVDTPEEYRGNWMIRGSATFTNPLERVLSNVTVCLHAYIVRFIGNVDARMRDERAGFLLPCENLGTINISGTMNTTFQGTVSYPGEYEVVLALSAAELEGIHGRASVSVPRIPQPIATTLKVASESYDPASFSLWQPIFLFVIVVVVAICVHTGRFSRRNTATKDKRPMQVADHVDGPETWLLQPSRSTPSYRSL